jgi:hypothetical protein
MMATLRICIDRSSVGVAGVAERAKDNQERARRPRNPAGTGKKRGRAGEGPPKAGAAAMTVRYWTKFSFVFKLLHTRSAAQHQQDTERRGTGQIDRR